MTTATRQSQRQEWQDSSEIARNDYLLAIERLLTAADRAKRERDRLLHLLDSEQRGGVA